MKLTEDDIQCFSNDEELLEDYDLNIEIHSRADDAGEYKQQILSNQENARNYKMWYEISNLDKEKLEQNLDSKIKENKVLKEKAEKSCELEREITTLQLICKKNHDENEKLKEIVGNCYNDEKRMGIEISKLKEIFTKIKILTMATEGYPIDEIKELLATKEEKKLTSTTKKE